MHIESLYLKNFRNYPEERVFFSEKTNLILGNNGQGKTNLLEAIFVLSTTKSFRHASDQKIKRWGTAGYRANGFFVTERGDFDISLEYMQQKKRVIINGVQEKKLSDIIGYVYCVLFSFEDIALITGPPYLRRGFLDLILATVDPIYFNNLKNYLQLIKQKNRYLRDSAIIDTNLLCTWNEQLAHAGSYILQKRVTLIHFINLFIEEDATGISQFTGPLKLVYRSTIPDVTPDSSVSNLQDSFIKALEIKMEVERRLQRAMVGPHRDDFSFFVQDSEIRFFGSIGEARLASIILKLSQSSYYRKVKTVHPLILIDDILLELDSGNRERVFSLFGEENQMVITTTERIRLPEIFSPDRVFHISDEGGIEWKGKGNHL